MWEIMAFIGGSLVLICMLLRPFPDEGDRTRMFDSLNKVTPKPKPQFK